MIAGYAINVTCLDCGGACDHLADGRVVGGTTTVAVAVCTVCRRQWLIQVQLRRVSNDGKTRADRARHAQRQTAGV